MNVTREIKKQKAIKFMKKLDIYKPYIESFEKNVQATTLRTSAVFGLTKSLCFWRKLKNSKKNTTASHMWALTNILNFGECYKKDCSSHD